MRLMSEGEEDKGVTSRGRTTRRCGAIWMSLSTVRRQSALLRKAGGLLAVGAGRVRAVMGARREREGRGKDRRRDFARSMAGFLRAR